MDDTQLRSRLIRLAHENPDLRSHILPILKESADKKEDPKALRTRWVETQRSLGQAEAKVHDLDVLSETVARIKSMSPVEMSGDTRSKIQDAAWKGEKLALEISELFGAFARKLRDF